MCGPSVPWDWLVLDVAYVLVLLGGSMIFKARSSPPVVWASFGILSMFVGGFLFYATWETQALQAEAAQLAASTSVVYFGC